MITVQEQCEINKLSTLRVGGLASYLWTCTKESEIPELMSFCGNHSDLPVFVAGEGSNTAFGESVKKIIVRPLILGKSIQLIDGNAQITVGAGENWDEFVEWCVQEGYQGLEALSAIPGSVGAAPIQNIGAYGAEVGEHIVSVKAFDLHKGQWQIFSQSECDFGYRESFFKNSATGRYVIVSVTFSLPLVSSAADILIPDYPGVVDKIKSLELSSPASLLDIRRAITEIRWSKLPRPEELPNLGSFFKNPVITESDFKILYRDHPNVPNWPVVGGYKIAAGWLIEQAGYKGKCIGPICTYEKSALIIVNSRDANLSDVRYFCQHLETAVLDMFGISLEVEPNLIE